MLKINADDLPRFMACNGSRLLRGETPSGSDTSQRDEGTAAHNMAVTVFNGHHTLDELIDRKAPNGVFMTSEMAQHVNDYLQQTIGDATFKQMEMETSHDGVDMGRWVVNGRADYAVVMVDGVLRIVDFKYGWRLVEPENNWTLISHAIGFFRQSKWTISDIELQIFQPRPYHPDGPLRTWKITSNDLSNFARQLDVTLSNPRDELVAGVNHCAKCPAIASCPAARKAEMNAIDATDMVFSDTVSNEMLTFSLDNLSRAQDMIKERLSAFQELAKHRIKAGQVVDNYSVDNQYGNTKFIDGMNGPMLKIITGKDLTTEKLVTPAEAKRQGVSEEVLKAITTRPMIGVKLERVKASKKAERLLAAK